MFRPDLPIKVIYVNKIETRRLYNALAFFQLPIRNRVPPFALLLNETRVESIKNLIANYQWTALSCIKSYIISAAKVLNASIISGDIMRGIFF